MMKKYVQSTSALLLTVLVVASFLKIYLFY